MAMVDLEKAIKSFEHIIDMWPDMTQTKEEVIDVRNYLKSQRNQQRKQTVVADGMPERITAYVAHYGHDWTNNGHGLNQGGTEYVRIDLCPPADVLKQVAEGLQSLMNGVEKLVSESPIFQMAGFNTTNGPAMRKAQQALAALSPYIASTDRE
jgi:hypothetical protein